LSEERPDSIPGTIERRSEANQLVATRASGLKRPRFRSLGVNQRSAVISKMPMAFALSFFGYQPITKRLDAVALQGTRRIDHVVGEASREAKFERPHQTPCGQVVRNQGATAEHDTFSPDRSLNCVIGR